MRRSLDITNAMIVGTTSNLWRNDMNQHDIDETMDTCSCEMPYWTLKDMKNCANCGKKLPNEPEYRKK